MSQVRTQNAFMTTVIIVVAMIGGVVGFWVAAWVVSKGGTQPLSETPLSQAVILGVWAAIALGGLAGALYLRREIDAAKGNDAKVLSRLLVGMALLEGPALLAGVALLLWGFRLPMLVNIPILLFGLVAVFPRQDMFASPE